MGMLRVMAPESAPSASIQRASARTPTSLRTVFNRVPVHSQQLSSPWVSWTVYPATGSPQFCVFPEHSRKQIRETAGKRIMSATVNIMGFATSPWMISRWAFGSIVGTPK